MLHPPSACPYAQPSLDLKQNKTEANWKSRSLWRRLFAKPIYLMQRNLNLNHSECVRECVLRVVWAVQLEEPRHVLLAQAQVDVSSRAISQMDRNVTTDTPQSVRMCVCVCARMIECVYRIISCVWGHISGMSSIMLPIYRSMLPGNMLQQRFHFDLIGCTSRAVLQQRHHHYMIIIIIILEPSAVIDIGQRCCLLWPIGGAFVPMLAFFSISPDSFSHSFFLSLSLSPFALLSFSHSPKQTNKIVIINRAEKRTEREREKEGDKKGASISIRSLKLKSILRTRPLGRSHFQLDESEIVFKCC